MHNGGFSTIETDRLILRPLSQDDAPEIFLLRSDEKHNEFVDRPRANSIEDAKAFISKISEFVNAGQSYFWVITVKPESPLAGTVVLWNIDMEKGKAEMGYELLSANQGKGIMSEAVAAVMKFAFSKLKLTRLEAWPHPNNKKSTSLLSKFGFTRDLEAEKNKPEGSEEAIYALKAEDHLYR